MWNNIIILIISLYKYTIFKQTQNDSTSKSTDLNVLRKKQDTVC